VEGLPTTVNRIGAKAPDPSAHLARFFSPASPAPFRGPMLVGYRTRSVATDAWRAWPADPRRI